MSKKAKRQIRRLIESSLGLYSLNGHFMMKCKNLSPVILDLGAGKGEFSDSVLTKYPSSRIILVEPVPDSVQNLVKKFEDQNNVEILAAAIGNNTVKECRFFLSKNWQENSLHKSLIVEHEGQIEIMVKTTSLEEILTLYDLKKIDLLKVDIEGEEWDFFEKFSKRDFERISQISVEFHDFLDSSYRQRTEKSIELLRGLGYSSIYSGTKYRHGTPYYKCLFYDKKRVNLGSLAKCFGFPKYLTDRI